MKSNNFFTLLLGVTLGFTALPQTTTYRIDTEEVYQTIDGFGASDAWRAQFVGKNWPQAKKEAIARLLFSQETNEAGDPKGIGLSIWRFNIGAGSAEQGEASGIKNEWRRGELFIDENGSYDWSKQEGQQWFLREAKNAGVEKFLAFSIAAPIFWSFNAKGYAETQDGMMNLKPEFYEDYADFLVEILAHFQSEGLDFDYLSPINEPQWDWEKATQEGTPATNENIANLTRRLNAKIKSKNLSTRLTLSEAADLRFLYSEYGKPKRSKQIQEFFDTSAQNTSTYIRDLEMVKPVISGHSYFTTWQVQDLIEIRQKLNDTLKKYNLGYWQSEFCILEKSDDIGQGGTRDLGMPTALYVARVIHADLTLANARSWQWWTAITRADFKDGLIYIDTGDSEDLYNAARLKQDGVYHDSKLLWAFGNYSRFVRPGMQRIAITSDSHKPLEEQYSNLMLSAFKNQKTGEVSVIAINYANQEQNLVLDADNLQFSHAYITSENYNLKHQPVANNTVKLAPLSVTTLTTYSL